MGREERDQLDLFGGKAAPEAAPSAGRRARGQSGRSAGRSPAAAQPSGADGTERAASGPAAPTSDEIGVDPRPRGKGEKAPGSGKRQEAPGSGKGEEAPGSGKGQMAPANGAGSRSERVSPVAATLPPEAGAGQRVEAAGRGGRGAWLRQAIQARLEGGPPAAPGRDEPGPAILTVGELARQIRGSLEQRFSTVHVRGEISNLRQPGSGHLYFSLKDDAACVRAVLFRGQARLLRFRPENGQEVVARGRVGFYEVAGDTQIVCEALEPVGAGALAVAFEQLKARLAAEGLFEAARKRPIPMLPRRIGVVTSPTGAAIRDFLRVLHRRFAGISVLVAPARVQGEGAAGEIAAGIRRLGARGDLDLIVLTRGGGSMEDLWAFNEEVVARAIAASPVPVVSAVGHEVDFTIADFVADLRAPTPTGAAELLAPEASALREGLAVARRRLERATIAVIERRRGAAERLRGRLGDPRRRLAAERLRIDDAVRRGEAELRRAAAARRARLAALVQRLRQAHPALQARARRRTLEALRERLRAAAIRANDARGARLRELRESLHRRAPHQRVLREATRLGERQGRMEALARRHLERRRARLAELGSRLEALSPLRVLARGYALAFRASGAVLFDAADAAPGERLHLELARGALEVEVVGSVRGRAHQADETASSAGGEGGPGSIDPGDGGR